MNRIPLLLAWRYIQGAHTQQTMSTMVRLCFGGIFIGTFSLTLILSIMYGFEQVTHAKFLGVHAPITIAAHGDTLDVEALSALFQKEFPEIAAYSPTSTQQVIIEGNSVDTDFTIVALRAVIPALEAGMDTIAKRFVPAHPEDTFTHALRDNRLIIGKKLAQELNLSTGDKVSIVYTAEQQAGNRQLALERASAIIGGIFDTGIDEFDAGIALCSATFFHTLFDHGPTHIGIRLKQGVDEHRTIERLRARLGLELFSWQDLYPALVAALKLEKYAMFLILALIILVASMNIVSLLFMQITHKRADIALLKAMGMSDRSVKTIFIIMGMMISTMACLAGLLVAAVAGFFLDRYPLMTLPDVYYVSHLPIQMSWSIVILVATTTLALGLLASWIPISRIGSITIAKLLRMQA